jgi:hypothetical protein
MTTIDLSEAAAPKSDQLNADDLISGPITIEITKVNRRDSGEQRISINYAGDNGKPWKPCKGMIRIMIEAWGKDGAKYPGRKLTLFRNPSVKWSGQEVGGIQISHMSHIEKNLTTVITESKTKRSKYVVARLETEDKQAPVSEPVVAKPPGDITQARKALSQCTPETVDYTSAELRKSKWTADEGKEIAGLIEAIKKPKVSEL